MGKKANGYIGVRTSGEVCQTLTVLDGEGAAANTRSDRLQGVTGVNETRVGGPFDLIRLQTQHDLPFYPICLV
jgi:hypothetical protein